MTIGLCGDLKFGRTVHSLINALIRYPGIRFVLISPEELKIPSYIREDVLRANNIPFEEVEEYTGHAPGGVCPFAVREGVRAYLDESLKRFETVYPAAGSANSAVRLTPQELEHCIENVTWIDVCK